MEYSTSSTHDSTKSGTAKEKFLKRRWQSLDAKKTSLYRRCEDYALWTLPYVFPELGIADRELNGAPDSTGARAVNNLANKIVMTLFPPYGPFFRLNVANDVIAELSEAAQSGDQDAKQILDSLDKILASSEKDAMRLVDYNSFRTEATMAVKSLIITGNSLMYHPANAKAQTYGLRDYCVVRDISGNVIELMTQDKKAFSTFSPAMQESIKKASSGKKYVDNTDVVLYTHFCYETDGKFHMQQAVDEFHLHDSSAVYTKEEFPYLVLTWNLVRGENYGRGLVEDYSGAFHALYVLNDSLIVMTGIAADIKFLVDPSSVIDVNEFNKSDSGSYHSGKEGDITTPQLNKQFDMQFVENAVLRFQQQIGQAFLMNSSVTRNAERVTAEEIRYVAQELEISHGGIYSRFADEWQLKLAILLLRRLNVKIGKDRSIYPQIITGLDSLSRAGDLDNLRMFVMDMQLLNEVPEEIRMVIDPLKFAEYIGIRRGVDYEKFTKTREQLQQDAQAQMQAQQAQMQMQTEAAVAQKAGGEIAKSAVQQ